MTETIRRRRLVEAILPAPALLTHLRELVDSSEELPDDADVKIHTWYDNDETAHVTISIATDDLS